MPCAVTAPLHRGSPSPSRGGTQPGAAAGPCRGSRPASAAARPDRPSRWPDRRDSRPPARCAAVDISRCATRATAAPMPSSRGASRSSRTTGRGRDPDVRRATGSWARPRTCARCDRVAARPGRARMRRRRCRRAVPAPCRSRPRTPPRAAAGPTRSAGVRSLRAASRAPSCQRRGDRAPDDLVSCLVSSFTLVGGREMIRHGAVYWSGAAAR
jgi:hypothetical protein